MSSARIRRAGATLLLAGMAVPALPGPADAAPAPQGLHHRQVQACARGVPTHAHCFAVLDQAVSADGTVQPAALGPGLTPAQIKKAYGFPGSLTAGAGTTIAIVDAMDAPTIEADLNTFSDGYGLPRCTSASGCFTKVNQRGSSAPLPATDSGWAMEISLDVQWAHAIAPAAKILLVEADSASPLDLLHGVAYAKTRASYVSLSWGTAETFDEANYDSYVTQPGVSFFVASGDNGAGAEWPSSSPNVVSVGGTSLAFNPDGTVASETGWSGSGGGCSRYENATAAQRAVTSICGTRRATPDVSLFADASIGVSVYDSTGFGGSSGWIRVGGTSAATPMVTARAAADGLVVNPAYVYGAALHYRDITSGYSGLSAGPGYDLVTGRGSRIDPPGAPTGLTATPGTGTVSLIWSPPAEGTVTRYTVYRSSGAQAPAALTTTTSPSYVDSSGVAGTSYVYSVSASNDTAEGPRSSVVTSGPNSGPVTVAGAPTSVVATPGNSSATITWQPPASTGGAVIDSYRVTPYAGGVALSPTMAGAAATSAKVTGLSNDTAYSFTVAAHNAAGWSPESAPAGAVTPLATLGPVSEASSTLPVSAQNPVVVTVDDPAGGPISFSNASAVPQPAGFDALRLTSYTVSAPPAVDAGHPLLLQFQVDGSAVPDGRPVVAGREGTPVTAACAGTGAAPDPCVASYAVAPDDVVTVTLRSTRASTWAMLTPARGSITTACAGQVGAPFTDLAGDVHATAVSCLSARQIANGTTATTYSPSRTVTREQMAAFLARLLTASGVRLTPDPLAVFSDVDPASVFATSIDQLAAVGVVRGTSATTYSPSAAVTRGQMAAFLVRAYELATGRALTASASSFTDVAGSPFAVEIGKVAALGVTQGATATTYAPGQPVRRDQMASFLARTLNLLLARGAV